MGVAPPVALAGLVALGVQYSVLDARRRDYTERINRLERESIGLKGTLEELAKNAKSIVSTNLPTYLLTYLLLPIKGN